MANKGGIKLVQKPKMELVEEFGISEGKIDREIRKAVVIDRAKGTPSKLVAAKYGISVASVQTIWGEFSRSIGTRTSDEDDPAKFRSKIRKKAVDAIEGGLECDRDPYRAAAIGVKVMEGIGEFRGQQGEGGVNIFMAGVPAEFAHRYFGINKQIQPETRIEEAITIPAQHINDNEGDNNGQDE